MRLSGVGMVAGVVGRPIARSLSPAIHNAWLAAAGLDGVYAPLSVTAERFEGLVGALRGGSLRGLNVTAPFKESALALADEADPAARAAGAANLLLFGADGRVEARNTDGLGLMAALGEQAGAFQPVGATVVLLGAGGAAKGAAAILLAAGVDQLRVVNRTAERAEALAETLGPKATAHDWGALEQALDGAALLVNATTLGRSGESPLSLPLERMRGDAVVMDMIYHPLRTALLARAEAAGLAPVDGLAMLIGQARPSFEALFGAPPPARVDARRVALEAMA